jgi:transposase
MIGSIDHHMTEIYCCFLMTSGKLAQRSLAGVAYPMRARVIWLPPYSPDYSPIEQMWSKVKEVLRAAKARTRQALERALTEALGLVSETDIRGWFRHCGYEVAPI